MPEAAAASPQKKRAPRTNKKQFDYSDVYYSDIVLEDMLYAVLVRSPVQCGAIAAIELPPLPEGVSFFGAGDIPGKNEIDVHGLKIPIFAGENIDYQGQPVGILVGPDETELAELVQSVSFSLNFTALPMGLEFSESFADEQLMASRSVLCGEPDRIFAESEHTFEQTFSLNLPAPPKERNGALAHCSGRQIIVYSNSRWASHLRRTIADALKIDPSAMVLHKTMPGLCRINDTWITSLSAAQAAVASYHTHKPVKLVYSMGEQRTYIEQNISASLRHRTSVAADGRITSMDVQILINAGAFNPFIQYILDRFAIAACGLYHAPNLRIDAYALKTNYAPLNCTFTWGDEQAFFAIENHVYNIARALGLGHRELKLKNLAALLPPKAAASRRFILNETKSLQTLVQSAMDLCDFERRNAAYSTVAQNPGHNDKVKRGIGLSLGFDGNGIIASDIRSKYSLEMTLETDGAVTIKVYSPTDQLMAIWRELVHKLLNIPQEQVRFESDYSHTNEPAEPDVLAENITIMTQLLKKCCKTLNASRFRQPLPITVRKNYAPPKKSGWNAEAFEGQPYQSTTWGCAIAEVEVDTMTYDVKARDVSIAIDGGEILDMRQATIVAQVAVTQAMRNYLSPQSLNTVTPKIHFIQSNEPPKQIGEIVANILPAAFSIAVAQALGKPITALPLNTNSIYKTISGNAEEAEAGDES